MARKITATIKYNNKDISADLQPYLKSISFTDNLSGAADDLQLTLEDRQGLWQSEWFPDKGAVLDATLVTTAWDSLAEIGKSLHLGLFEIDEITSGGYPSEVQIKAVSVPNNTTLRGVERTRSWEKAELRRIAGDMAADAELELVYDAEDNPLIDRAEQTQQSDLSFLLALCNDAGLALKVCSSQLVIFDEANYEAADPIATIIKPGTVYLPIKDMDYISAVTGYRFSSKVRDIYAACHVKYRQSKTKAYIEATFTAPDKQGKTLEVSEQVESVADAERLAKKRLREKNREEVTASFDVLGNFNLLAGVTVNILGFGKFDGKYIVVGVRHDVGSGYNTGVELRRCLDGY